MYPTSPCKAYLALGMAPGTPAKLEARAREAGKTLDDVTIPMGSVKLFKGGRGTALEVEIMPTPEKPLEMFKGWGVVPLVLTVDDAQRPKSEEIRKDCGASCGSAGATTWSQGWLPTMTVRNSPPGHRR